MCTQLVPNLSFHSIKPFVFWKPDYNLQDRLVRWGDFEKLTGGIRESVRGDAAKRLERRCVWETTCPDTGMPNAYVVCALREKEARWGPGGGTKRDGGDGGDELVR